jgi:hypothetical protein
MKNLTPEYISKLRENIVLISNEDKKRLSRQRRNEILGYCHLKKRQIDSWIEKLLLLDSWIKTNESSSLQTTIHSPNTPMWKLYNTLTSISNDLGTEIDSYTYWNKSEMKILIGSNSLSNRIENRVLSKGKNNPYYTHLEATLEIAEEEGLEFSNIKNLLSKSILQKIEAIGVSRKELKGSTATLPF